MKTHGIFLGALLVFFSLSIEAQICVLDQELYIAERSSGLDAEEDLLPGERVRFCYRINTFSPENNNCQWLQGVIPVFGNGWDPSQLGAFNLPSDARLNGNPFPVEGLYAGEWDAFDDVTHNADVPFLYIGDPDNNGRPDLCNETFQSPCPGNSVSADDILPSGWFNANPGDGPPDGHPNIDWGDGNGCSGNMGPWEFCFDLYVRMEADPEDVTEKNLDLAIFSFSDGETGSWQAGLSVCADDPPLYFSGKLAESSSTETVSSANIVVHPNPASSFLFVRLPESSLNETSFVMADALGRKVLSVQLTSGENRIDLFHLNAGIFFYRVGNFRNGILIVQHGK